MSKQVVCLDFEFSMKDSTSPQGFFPEIIEVGMVIVQDNQIYDTYSAYVQPAFFPTLSDRCKNFLSLEQEQVDHGITFSELIETLELVYQLSPTTLITWGNMDTYVLKMNCEKYGISYPSPAKSVDLSLDYKRFFGDRNQTGLWKALEAYGEVGKGKHHRALDDALSTYEIFKKIEKDKRFLNQKEATTLGDIIDFSALIKRFVS